MHASRSSRSLFHGLVLVSRCPLCEAVFDPLETNVLVEEGEHHLLHIRCKSCGHAVLALVVVSREGVYSVGMLTDCSSEDALRFRNAAPLGTDDVLRAHLELRNAERFLAGLHPS